MAALIVALLNIVQSLYSPSRLLTDLHLPSITNGSVIVPDSVIVNATTIHSIGALPIPVELPGGVVGILLVRSYARPDAQVRLQILEQTILVSASP